MEKTTIFNLIILDESGSMSGLTSATIEGCNSVLATARQVQQENADTQRVLVSIYAFQSGFSVPSRYIVHNEPADKVRDIDTNAYQPNGCTPLYDAIGTTLTELEAVAKTHEDATGVITIITDGMENSSTVYSHSDVVKLIDRFKEMGWVVNFLGANIDVEKAAGSLHISNTVRFSHSSDGMRDTMRDLNISFMTHASEDKYLREIEDPAERLRRRKERGKRFFSK